MHPLSLLSVEAEDLGVHLVLGRMPRTPNMNPKVKNIPKVSFIPETNFEPKIGGSINYRPEKAKYSGRKARRACGRAKREMLLW